MARQGRVERYRREGENKAKQKELRTADINRKREK